MAEEAKEVRENEETQVGSASEGGEGDAVDLAEADSGRATDAEPNGAAAAEPVPATDDLKEPVAGGASLLKTLKSRPLAVAAVCAACVLIAVGIGYYSLVAMRATMPDLTGADARAAYDQLAGLGGPWDITVTDEDGNPVDVSDEAAFDRCEVKSASPEPGASLSKFDAEQSISVTIGKVEKMTAAQRDEKIAYAEEHFSDYGELASALSYTNLTGSQQDGFVAFRGVCEQTAVETDEDGPWVICEVGTSDDGYASWTSSMASELGCNVLLAEYSNDGYLIDVYVVPHVDSTTSEWEATQKAAVNLVASAQEFAQAYREDMLGKYTAAVSAAEFGPSVKYWPFAVFSG